MEIELCNLDVPNTGRDAKKNEGEGKRNILKMKPVKKA